MRLNTRNIVLVLVGVAVMAALIFFGTRDADAPAEEATETAAESGPLFPEIAAEDVVRFEVRGFEQEPDPDDPTPTPTATPFPDAPPTEPPAMDPGEVVLTKDDEDIWTIEEATNSTDRETDQLIVVGTIANVAGLEYADRFSINDTESTLENFGLVEPSYEIILETADTTQTLTLGNTNPGGRRFYAQLDGDDETIYLVATDILNNVVNYTLEPPYVPAPTDTPTPLPTANPFSEVEQTATADAMIQEMMTAQAESAPTETPLGPAPAPSNDDDEATEEVTEEVEATEEMTEEAEATEEMTEEATEEAE